VAVARGLPAREGILNFGQVNELVYRGAQPDAAGLSSLQKLGIKSVINLRTDPRGSKTEAAAAQALGLAYTNVPMAGFSRPKDTQVQLVLSLIETLPGPVFVHCKHGCDRTGTIIACYRIRKDAWSVDKATQEANRYGLWKWMRGMRQFIKDFGAASDKTSKGPGTDAGATGGTASQVRSE
jgi:protein tyrosine/serine phosphatase